MRGEVHVGFARADGHSRDGQPAVPKDQAAVDLEGVIAAVVETKPELAEGKRRPRSAGTKRGVTVDTSRGGVGIIKQYAAFDERRSLAASRGADGPVHNAEPRRLETPRACTGARRCLTVENAAHIGCALLEYRVSPGPCI